MNQQRSGTFKIYKSSGAAQFSIIDPKFNERGFLEKEGAILVEACPCNGKDKNGNINALWKQKISFAISIADIAGLMDRTNPKAGRLYHNHSGYSKTLQFVESTDPRYAGTYMLQMQTTDSQKNSHRVSVPLSNGQYELIMRLIVGTGAARIIAWD